MATHYEIHEYRLNPKNKIYSLCYADGQLNREWTLGELTFLREDSRKWPYWNGTVESVYDNWNSYKWEIEDALWNNLLVSKSLEEYLNFGLSLQLLEVDDDSHQSKVLERKDYTFDDFDKQDLRPELYKEQHIEQEPFVIYRLYAQELEAEPYASRVSSPGKYLNRRFDPSSWEHTYLESSREYFVEHACTMIDPKDLFYDSIRGESREANFINRGFEVGCISHNQADLLDEKREHKEFTYDDWHRCEYPEEYYKAWDENEPQSIYCKVYSLFDHKFEPSPIMQGHEHPHSTFEKWITSQAEFRGYELDTKKAAKRMEEDVNDFFHPLGLHVHGENVFMNQNDAEKPSLKEVVYNTVPLWAQFWERFSFDYTQSLMESMLENKHHAR